MVNSAYFFPGANSYKGFFSYFDNIISPKAAKKIYVIKGGPGTGKSTFMRKIGNYLNEKGYFVEYFHCSSDVDSLDGICIPELGIAFIDGTAPHVIDPVYPGAVDEIINLGDYFDVCKLEKDRESIININNEISEQFKNAYSVLRAINSYKEILLRIEEKYISEGYLNKLYENICQQIFGYARVSYRKGQRRKLFLSAITPQGFQSFIKENAKRFYNVFVINSEFESSLQILNKIMDYAIERGFDVEMFYCGFNPKKLEHLAIPELSTFIITSNRYHTITDSTFNNIKVDFDKAFNGADRELFNEVNLHISNEFVKVINFLKKAKGLHDELEKFYIQAMDFDSVENKFKEVCDELESFII
ncbi:ATPase [Caldicellulosiruptoraceae bacterium PP1]